MENIQNLLSKVRHLVELDNKQKEEARKRGENYNIFSVLKMETAERETHSAFLASLLNPDGDHGMKDAFLASFIAKTGCRDLQLDTLNCTIEVEHYTGDGRLDILIADNSAHKAIIVENKIYAGDQNAQMKRYHDYATANYKEGFRLLYLTLDGHEPSPESLKGLTEKDYQLISYRNDMLPWLEQCAKASYNKPLVREVINQYISLIKKLSNMENNLFETSLDMLTSEEYIETTLNIVENSWKIQCKIRELFAQKIQQECELMGLECTCDEGIKTASDNSWITISHPLHKNINYKIGVFRHTNNDGFRMCFKALRDDIEKSKFWDEGYVPTDDFPLGWTYLWSETGVPNSGRWWRWDEWPTLRDMTNGKMLAFIRKQLQRMIDEHVFE